MPLLNSKLFTGPQDEWSRHEQVLCHEGFEEGLYLAHTKGHSAHSRRAQHIGGG